MKKRRKLPKNFLPSRRYLRIKKVMAGKNAVRKIC